VRWKRGGAATTQNISRTSDRSHVWGIKTKSRLEQFTGRSALRTNRRFARAKR